MFMFGTRNVNVEFSQNKPQWQRVCRNEGTAQAVRQFGSFTSTFSSFWSNRLSSKE